MTTPNLAELRIGVLYGGRSPERPGSIASGEAAFKSLGTQGLCAELLDIGDIEWDTLSGRIDVALLASHGLGGEDGKVQGVLDTLGIPYTGSGVNASSIGMNKGMFKRLLTTSMIDTPRWVEVDPTDSTTSTVNSVTATLGFPVFIKPTSGGGSLEAGIAHDHTELSAALEKTRQHPYNRYMIEEYVPGVPCTIGVLEVDGALTTLPIHTVETDRPFYDYEAKHDLSLRREQCPADLEHTRAVQLRNLALRAHRLIGAHGVSRVDFLLSPSGRTPMLEVNTVPGLSERGNLATMANAAGIEYPELIRRILATAFTKPAYVP